MKRVVLLVVLSMLVTGCNLGGQLSGLEQGNSLQIRDRESGELLVLSENGSFTFEKNYGSGDAYAIEIISHSKMPFQFCNIRQEEGVFGTGNITSVNIECVTPTTVQRSISSSIAYDEAGDAIFVTSPDDRRLVKLNAASLEEIAGLDLLGSPQTLSMDAQRILVTQPKGFVIVDKTSFSVAESVTIPCGDPAHINLISTQSDAYASISCPLDQRLIMVDLSDVSKQYVIATTGRTNGLLYWQGNIISSIENQNVMQVWALNDILKVPTFGPDPHQSKEPVVVPNVESINLSLNGQQQVSQFSQLTSNRFGAIAGLFQTIDNNNRQREPSSGGYGSVVDGAPRIEPRVLSECGSHFAVFDGGNKVFSGPSALALADEYPILWVVNRYTQNVTALFCDQHTQREVAGNLDWIDQNAWDDSLEQMVQFQVGPGARGIALSSDGLVAYVDVGFHHAVAKLELRREQLGSRDVALPASVVKTRSASKSKLSLQAQNGRKLFFDASNTHLTPSGVVTCATCHPKGGDDGIVWFLHTENVKKKFRRTPPAWGGRQSLAPFHWDSEFNDGGHLSNTTIRELLEGDGLLIDIDAITQYMEEITLPTPPHVPQWQQALVAEGQVLFADRCQQCHSGALYSDNSAHQVLVESSDEPAQMVLVNTPSLIGVRGRAPFLHDGRAASLMELLTVHNSLDQHGVTSDLNEAQLKALFAYLSHL